MLETAIFVFSAQCQRISFGGLVPALLSHREIGALRMVAKGLRQPNFRLRHYPLFGVVLLPLQFLPLAQNASHVAAQAAGVTDELLTMEHLCAIMDGC